MNYWYFKSEPNCWSWQQQVARKARGEPWDGVRNYQARNNMRAMQVDDLGLFYHSIGPKEFVGIVKVIRLAYPDHTAIDDPRWEMVNVAAVKELTKPVTLADMKANDRLEQMEFLRQGRLSVGPVTAAEFKEILRMSGTKL